MAPRAREKLDWLAKAALAAGRKPDGKPPRGLAAGGLKVSNLIRNEIVLAAIGVRETGDSGRLL